jgi:hypothetical protein
MFSTIGRVRFGDFMGFKEYQPKYHALLCMFVVNSCHFELSNTHKFSVHLHLPKQDLLPIVGSNTLLHNRYVS